MIKLILELYNKDLNLFFDQIIVKLVSKKKKHLTLSRDN